MTADDVRALSDALRWLQRPDAPGLVLQVSGPWGAGAENYTAVLDAPERLGVGRPLAQGWGCTLGDAVRAARKAYGEARSA